MAVPSCSSSSLQLHSGLQNGTPIGLPSLSPPSLANSSKFLLLRHAFGLSESAALASAYRRNLRILRQIKATSAHNPSSSDATSSETDHDSSRLLKSSSNSMELYYENAPPIVRPLDTWLPISDKYGGWTDFREVDKIFLEAQSQKGISKDAIAILVALVIAVSGFFIYSLNARSLFQPALRKNRVAEVRSINSTSINTKKSLLEDVKLSSLVSGTNTEKSLEQTKEASFLNESNLQRVDSFSDNESLSSENELLLLLDQLASSKATDGEYDHNFASIDANSSTGSIASPLQTAKLSSPSFVPFFASITSSTQNVNPFETEKPSQDNKLSSESVEKSLEVNKSSSVVPELLPKIIEKTPEAATEDATPASANSKPTLESSKLSTEPVQLTHGVAKPPPEATNPQPKAAEPTFEVVKSPPETAKPPPEATSPASEVTQLAPKDSKPSLKATEPIPPTTSIVSETTKPSIEPVKPYPENEKPTLEAVIPSENVNPSPESGEASSPETPKPSPSSAIAKPPAEVAKPVAFEDTYEPLVSKRRDLDLEQVKLTVEPGKVTIEVKEESSDQESNGEVKVEFKGEKSHQKNETEPGKGETPAITREPQEKRRAVEHPGEPVSPYSISRASLRNVGRIIVPAVVDSSHAQAFEAFQTLKVIEKDLDMAEICTRREFARWIISTTNVLSRSTAKRVFPAMYVDGHTDIAFDDVLPDDPDFPFIQGLAEAGLIPSKLSSYDIDFNSADDYLAIESLFKPDSPLTRQDLVSWRVALQYRSLPDASVSDVKNVSGFIDAGRISKDSLPSIYCDLQAGEDSIISSAFGYTRRFEPFKPVTRAQAACALAVGDSAALIAEELVRLDAEMIAEMAIKIAAEEEAEILRLKQSMAESAKKELEKEREKRIEAENALQAVISELQQAKDAYLLEKEAVETAREAVVEEEQKLDETRVEVEKTMSLLFITKEALFDEKKTLETLLSEVEFAKAEAEKAKGEMEKQKEALCKARTFAADEAKKTEQEAKSLIALRRELSILEAKLPENSSVVSALHSLPHGFEVNHKVELPWEKEAENAVDKSSIVHGFTRAIETVSSPITAKAQSLVNMAQNSVGNFMNSKVEQGKRAKESLEHAMHNLTESARAKTEPMFRVVKSAEDNLKAVASSAEPAVGTAASTVSEVAKKLSHGCRESALKFSRLMSSSNNS